MNTLYNFETYSVLDIQKYLHEKGFETEFVKYKKVKDVLQVLNTNVYIDIPIYVGSSTITASIRFDSYPKKENFEEDKKLYQFLARKFRVKKNEYPKKIKDSELLPVQFPKKGIWPFNKIF